MNITVRDVYKSFEGKPVLAGYSATFPEGEVSCIAGASGVGKTTLLGVLMGLVVPDRGAVEGVAGRPLSAVFQEERFCENLSALRNVALVMPGQTNKPVIEAELSALGLEAADFYTPVSTLSGGMRRRVAIARALLADYELLLMDEPFKGLDDAIKAQVIAHVKARAAGKTVIMVTHDLREATQMGARLFAMA